MTTDFLDIFDQANALALQPDGKIVAAGITGDQMTRADIALARYNSDGSLDASFGSGGKVVTDFVGGVDAAGGIALQPDGRIVAAGASFVGMLSDFALVRYNTDGSLDASFGVGGKVTTDFSAFGDSAKAVGLLPDGRIIAAGSSFRSSTLVDFALARYKSDGSLDPSFGAGGKVITDFFGFSDQPYKPMANSSLPGLLSPGAFSTKARTATSRSRGTRRSQSRTSRLRLTLSQ